MRKRIFAAFAGILTVAVCIGAPHSIVSPDGKNKLEFNVERGKAAYAFFRNGKVAIRPSALGFKFKNMPPMMAGFTVESVERSSFDEIWEQPWGETRYIKNSYNQLTVHLKEAVKPNRKLDVVFRVFNDGLSFRYIFPKQKGVDSLIVSDEITEFRLSGDNSAWWTPVHGDNSYYESIPRHTLISKTDTVNTPVTMLTADSVYLAIHEANLTDYASMTLLNRGGNVLTSELVPWSNGVKVYAKAPFATPWRMVIVADKPGDLVTSTMMLNLNDPCKIENTDWIKPSKYIGIWWGMHMEKYTWGQGPKHGATTKNTIEYMNFAAKNGFAGVLVEGWNYGWDGDWSSNGNGFSFTKPYPDFDIQKITDYGKSVGVQLIGHHETGGAAANYERQMEDAFALYHRMGVNAVKTGYVNKYLDGKEWHDSQYGVRHYRKVMELAAKYQIMVDNHEPVKPTGICRTYPNFMTQEGGRGQEYDAWSADGGNSPVYTTIIPFTRMLAGPFDFTPGTFCFENSVKPGTRVQTTLAKQLALFVVIYSPLQMASDLPENYAGNPAFQFIKDVPCDWETTLSPDAEIGEYVTMVRKDRNSDDWYVGAITNEKPREITLNLSFLKKGCTYRADVYADGANADWKTNPYALSITSNRIKDKSSLVLKLASGGGCAVRFHKLD